MGMGLLRIAATEVHRVLMLQPYSRVPHPIFAAL